LLELTCQDEELEVLVVGDLAVLRTTVMDAVAVNIPLTIAGAAEVVALLTLFVQPALN
jgi:hypothetical protein